VFEKLISGKERESPQVGLRMIFFQIFIGISKLSRQTSAVHDFAQPEV
jgi:hypothetical protein